MHLAHPNSSFSPLQRLRLEMLFWKDFNESQERGELLGRNSAEGTFPVSSQYKSELDEEISSSTHAYLPIEFYLLASGSIESSFS
jgi:hypothetical protein